MKSRPLWAALLLGSVACTQAPAPKQTPKQDWFRIAFGTGDAEPADWSGAAEVTGGRLATIGPWRFDKDDKLNPDGKSWVCHTRFGAVPDPQQWFVGALHILPNEMTPAKPKLVPNGFFIGIEGGTEVKLTTPNGDVKFNPAEVTPTKITTLLNGRVEVERVATPRNLTGTDGMQDDAPAVAVDSAGAVWAAWIGYQAEKEKLIAARADGSGYRVVAEGEFARPSIAVVTGRIFVAASVRAGDTWKIGVVSGEGGAWGKLEFVSNGGPDLFPRLVASGPRLWLIWQGFRDGRSRILARALDGNAWGAEMTVSDNSRNAWEPAAAADAKGNLHVAWDAYDGGVYNVWYRAIRSPGTSGPGRRVWSSPGFQAHASVTVDTAGAVWLAWDESGVDWGKDTGFLIKTKKGSALYESRLLRVAKVGESGITLAPQLAPGRYENAQLVPGPGGSLACLVKRLSVKLHEVYSPSLKKNRLQQQSFWDYAVYQLSGNGWSSPVTLPLAYGRNDFRGAIAPGTNGRVAVAWAGDGRTFAKPYPFVKNEVFAAEIELPAGSPPATAEGPKYGPPSPAVHPKEAEQVAKIRAERIPAGGKQLRILRGDMHRHTDISFDGDIDGSVWDFYRYTIDAADFDYSALTDHNAGDDIEYFWWTLQKAADLFHYPGRFAPLFAYERSLRYPNGHRNLIWAKRGVKTLPRSPGEESGKEGAAKLYEYLRKTGGLAMSHTSATLMGTDWRDNDKDLEPLVEIYQGDRTSAEYEGAPRAPKGNDPFTQPGGYQPEGFVWNAWAKGYKLGVQSSSDHASTHISYAVVLAEDITREAVVKGIAARHAYAATDNIILDVRSGDQIQGDIFQSAEKPKITIRVEGTAPVDVVEVVKNNKFVFKSRPGKASVQLTYEDNDSKPGESYYYVRIQQQDGQMAWSSPMWITR